MKSMFKTALLVAGAFLVTAFTIVFANWNIDADYTIKFSGRKAEGTFSGLKGTIRFDPDSLSTAYINVTVDAATIKTGNNLKDKHARGSSWFDVEKYPEIKFTSSAFSKQGDTTIVTGTLELHGVQKEVVIPFTFINENNKGLFAGRFTINRKDYGIKGTALGFSVGDEFEVTLRVPVTKAD
jgi:polyisoprenoid-binding protein YceI